MPARSPPATPTRQSARIRATRSTIEPISKSLKARTGESQQGKSNEPNGIIRSKSVQSKVTQRSTAVNGTKEPSTHTKSVPASKQIGLRQAKAVDDLTDSIQKIEIEPNPAGRRIISKTDAKQKGVQRINDVKQRNVTASVPEQINQGMKAVNTQLSKLMEIRQSGWKMEEPLPGPTKRDATSNKQPSENCRLEEALQAINLGFSALSILRRLIVGSDGANKAYDLERAGLALINHALELRLYNPALRLLEIAHGFLQLLITPSVSSLSPINPIPRSITSSSLSVDSWESCSKTLTFEIPDHKPDTDSSFKDVALLLITAMAQAFQAFLRAPSGPSLSSMRSSLKLSSAARTSEAEKAIKIRANCCIRALESTGSLTKWTMLLTEDQAIREDGGLTKKLSAATQTSYMSVVRACAGWENDLEPRILFRLRQLSIISFMSYQSRLNQPVDSSIEQARRALLLYARSSSDQLSNVVSDARACFTHLVQIVQDDLHRINDSSQHKGWVGLCETVIALARKTGELDLVDQVITFIDTRRDPIVPPFNGSVIHNPNEGQKDPERHANGHIVLLTTSISILEHFMKTNEDRGVKDYLSKSTLSIVALSYLTPLVPSEVQHKSKIVEDRLRRMCLRLIKRPSDSECTSTSMQDLRTMCSSVSSVLIELWITELAKSVQRTPDPTSSTSILSMMIVGSVDTLVTLAETTFKVAEPESYFKARDHLGKCESLIRLLPEPDVSIIRCLTSAYYNTGVALYHTNKLASAVEFIKPSCEIPERFLGLVNGNAPWHSYQDSEGEVDTLRKQLVKRWELLALCYLQTDKIQSYHAYVSAILCHRSSDFANLGRLVDEGAQIKALTEIAPGICKLVQRVTRLTTSDPLFPSTSCSLLQHLGSLNMTSSAEGAMLEIQLHYLSQNTARAGCKLATKILLQDCLKIYDVQVRPIRRLKTLCRLMEWHVSMSAEGTPQSIYEISKELLGGLPSLLEREDYGTDARLREYGSQYLILGHMWVALAAQSNGLQEEFLGRSQEAVIKLEETSSSLISEKQEISSTISNSKPSSHLSRKVSKSKTQTHPRPPARSGKGQSPPTTPSNQRIANGIRPTHRTLDNKSGFDSPTSLHPKHKNHGLQQNTSQPKPLVDDLERYTQHLKLFSSILGAHGLITLKLRSLFCLQKISLTCLKHKSGCYVSTTLELASTYMQLEEHDEFGNLLSEAQRLIKTLESMPRMDSVSCEVSAMLLHSRYTSEKGDMDQARASFELAGDKWKLFDEDEEESNRSSEISSTQKIIRRTQQLQMIALASSTFSHLQERRGELHLAIESALRAVRLLHRASSNIFRISSLPSKTVQQPVQTDLFSNESKPQDCVPLVELTPDVKPRAFTLESHPIGEMTWNIVGTITTSLERLIRLYLDRGSSRTAEGYLVQLLTMADQIGSRRLKAHALNTKAEILILKADLDSAKVILQESQQTLADESCLELAEIWMLRCKLSYKSKSFEEAKIHGAQAKLVLDNVKKCSSPFVGCVGLMNKLLTASSRSTNGEITSISSFTPMRESMILASIARVRALIARSMKNSEDPVHALDLLREMPPMVRERVFEATLTASLEVKEALQNFRVDPLLGVLQEAMVVIPQFESSINQTKHWKDPFPNLTQALHSVHEALSTRTIGCGDVVNLYETIHTLVNLKFVTCILQRAANKSASEVASLLDFVCSLTIRREVLEYAFGKLRSVDPMENLQWPGITSDQWDLSEFERLQIDSGVDRSQPYWERVAEHHILDVNSPSTYRPLENLPAGWRIVSIHLASEQDSLFVVQHTSSRDPLVVKLPLDRFNRREGEDEPFTLSIALSELEGIVSKSNAATQRARHVSGHAEKVSWWQERKELDTRMRALVENIENNWLGACKGLLRSCNFVADMSVVRDALEKVFRRHLLSIQDKSTPPRPLDDHIVRSFISLPIKCRDEDLEDLVQFAIDTYQIHEAPVVGDEVDADQVVCELRDIQKEMLTPCSKEQNAKEHLFLILDKKLQGFPWEVLPILVGHSVSRIPSLSFLRDRLMNTQSSPGALLVDSKHTSYILNPSGDLHSTQTQFESWLESNSTWTGIKARAPSSEEVKRALQTSDVVLYFGHGGAEQYIRSSTIKGLSRCATTMLWGCSSGMLQDQGEMEPTGTPYAYMLAGCPCLLANLWDVTDKDIDRLAIDLFKRTGLQPSDRTASDALTLTGALAQARSSCQLKYLNGAAPIVYGIPVRFSASTPAFNHTKLNT